MAQAGVIRDFMVALGFKTDNSGLKQMQDAMGGVELKAVALKGALLALATGAVVAVRQTASELDKLYFSSQRIGASVTNINAYGNAIAQLGGSAEGAIGSLDSLAEKMRNSPGYEGMINSLGVQTKDANGAVRDRVEVMKDLSGVLSKMPAYQANAYASSLGIDQNTLMAMRDGKFVSNMEKYQKIQKELGMNDDLAKSGNEFMTEYRDLTMMTKTGFQVIVMQAGKALIPILRLLNQMLQAGISAFSQLNPQIKEGLAVGLRFAMLAVIFGGFFKVFGLIFKFIPMLKSFIGLLKLMRLAFLASPIGIILALAAALGLLYDDYKTWRDGGKSLFDWSKWTNGIDTIIQKIKDFLEILDQVKDKVINFVQKVISDPVGAIKEVAEVAADGVKELAQKGVDALNDKIAETEQGAKALDKIGETTAKTLAFFGNEEAKKAVETNEGKPAVTAKGLAAGAAKAVDKAVKQTVSGASNSYANLGRLIASGEGDYNSVNRGLVKGKNLGSFQTDLSKMTINQILARNKLKPGDKNRMNAVGKYQVIASTMKQAMKAMGLSGNEKFTPELQEKIFREFLIPKRKGLNDYLKGGKTSLGRAQYEAAMEWASIPVPKGFKTQSGRISDGTVTYYDTNKGNRAKKGHGGKIRAELQNIRSANAVKKETPSGRGELANFAQNADMPNIQSYTPPSGNLHKSQVNAPKQKDIDVPETKVRLPKQKDIDVPETKVKLPKQKDIDVPETKVRLPKQKDIDVPETKVKLPKQKDIDVPETKVKLPKQKDIDVP
ncbi:hypothetical protein, partial [Acinetobacter towneri]